MTTHPIMLVVATFFVVFCTSVPAKTETPDEAVTTSHLIIAADYSGSMHNSYSLPLLTNAIVSALDTYGGDCTETRITYLAWGDTIIGPYTVALNEAENRYDLMLYITELAQVNLRGTNHRLALETAMSVIDPNERTVVLLLTDDKAHKLELPPIDFELHKIAIQVAGVAESLEEKFLPNQGTVHFAASTTELTTLVRRLLEETRIALCLG